MGQLYKTPRSHGLRKSPKVPCVWNVHIAIKSGQVVVLPKELAELFSQDASLNIGPPAVTHVLQGFGALPVKHAKIGCKWLFEGRIRDSLVWSGGVIC